MRAYRPYVPVDVRLEVITRQCHAMVPALAFAQALYPTSKGERLKRLLALRFDGQPVQLDHDPPLGARPFSTVTGKFKPPANDPRYLIYRVKEDHRVKTFVRGEHGQYSDVALIKRERRRQKKKCPVPIYSAAWAAERNREYWKRVRRDLARKRRKQRKHK